MSKLNHGVLISIEGIDGSGKSTLANRLKAKLVQENFDVILTYEPGDSQLGKHLRKILQERDFDICNKSEYLLFAADRAQHFEDVVIPSLRENKIVISDRMGDSSVVYQGYGRQESIDMINLVNKWAMRDIKPDITFYVKVSIETALERVAKRKTPNTVIEKEKEKFTKKLISGFDELYANRQDVIIIDGEQDSEVITNTAHASVKQWLKDRKYL